MFLTISIAIKSSQYTYHTDRKAEIVFESDFDTLFAMSCWAGETVSEAMSKLIDAEQQAQRRLLAEAETAEEE